MQSGNTAVLFGYTTKGRVDGKPVLCIGRSRVPIMMEPMVMHNKAVMKDLLVRRSKIRGLNKPDRILFWIRVPNVSDRVWAALRKEMSKEWVPNFKPLPDLGNTYYSLEHPDLDFLELWFTSFISMQANPCMQPGAHMRRM